MARLSPALLAILLAAAPCLRARAEDVVGAAPRDKGAREGSEFLEPSGPDSPLCRVSLRLAYVQRAMLKMAATQFGAEEGCRRLKSVRDLVELRQVEIDKIAAESASSAFVKKAADSIRRGVRDPLNDEAAGSTANVDCGTLRGLAADREAAAVKKIRACALRSRSNARYIAGMLLRRMADPKACTADGGGP